MRLRQRDKIEDSEAERRDEVGCERTIRHGRCKVRRIGFAVATSVRSLEEVPLSALLCLFPAWFSFSVSTPRARSRAISSQL